MGELDYLDKLQLSRDQVYELSRSDSLGGCVVEPNCTHHVRPDLDSDQRIAFSNQNTIDLDWQECSEGMSTILIIVHGYPPLHTSGAEYRAERTARVLRMRGFEVRVLCFEQLAEHSNDVYWNDSNQDDIYVRRLFFRNAHHEQKFRDSYDNPLVGIALEAMLQEWRPDIVYLFGGFLMSASVVRIVKAAGLPLFITLTDYWWLCHRINLLNTQNKRCDGPQPLDCARCLAESSRSFQFAAKTTKHQFDWLWRVAGLAPLLQHMLGVQLQSERRDFLLDALHQADVLITPSRYLAEYYIHHGVEREKIRFLRQGVELDLCPLRKKSAELRVGYIGQIKPHKGVHLLLEAWSQLRGANKRQLKIYGPYPDDGHYATYIDDRIASMDDVSWKGHFLGPQIWDVLSDLDIVVLPSRWLENSPNAILEAQAMGVAVIGSNIGGIAELVQHEQNGLLFCVDDSADLARQLQRILDKPQLLERLRQHTMPFISKEAEIDQLIQLFRTMIEGKNKA